MKILLVTFSDNADHQDTVFGLYEQMYGGEHDIYLLAIKTPKVSLSHSDHTWLVDCPKRPGIEKKTFDLPTLFSIVRKVQKGHFDVIFFESLHTWNLPIMLFSGKAHTYQEIHDVIPHKGDKQVKMVELMNKVVTKLADTIVLANKSYIPYLQDHYHLPSSRITYLELWRRYPSYTEPQYSGKILFFGRINPYKGADNLLLLTDLCPEIKFEIVGRVDEQMQSLAEQLRAKPNVTLNDSYVTDTQMRDAFIRCDWVILPYNSATQSGVIIDSYKYSRPVIAFDVGAISEQVAAGCSGYLVEAGNITKFAETLRTAVAMDKEAYHTITQNAYKYGSLKYAVSGAVPRFLQMLLKTGQA